MKFLIIKEFIRKTDIVAIMIKLLLIFLVILSIFFVTEALYHPTPLPFFFGKLLRLLPPLLISYGLGIAIFLVYTKLRERADLIAKIIRGFLIFWAILLLLLLLFLLFLSTPYHPAFLLLFWELLLTSFIIPFISYVPSATSFLVFKNLKKRADLAARVMKLLSISWVVSFFLAFLAIVLIRDLLDYAENILDGFKVFISISMYLFIAFSIFSAVGLLIFLVLRKIIHFITKQSRPAKKTEKEN